jgi:DNA-binding LacI/PurR family transcriptional regulator
MSENLMLAHIFDHIQNELIANDYDVMMVYDYGPGRKESVLERMIRRRKLDGLILFRKILSENETALIRNLNFPCVFMLNNDTSMETVSKFFSDNEHGGFLAGRFLGQFKDYSPVYIGALEDGEKTSEQLLGLRRGLALHKRKLPKAAVLQCHLSIGAAYDFVMKHKDMFLKTKRSVFPHTDIIAIGVLAALRDLGAGIPEQAQVLGADDVPMTEWLRPRLSAVHIPVPEMVRSGCAHLRELIDGKKHSVAAMKFPPTLILRDTTLPGGAETE